MTRQRPRPDLHALDDVDRGDRLEELEKLRVVVHELPVADAARPREAFHRLVPAVQDFLPALAAAGQRERVEPLFEGPERDRLQAVAVVDRLALLGDAQPAAPRRRRQTAHDGLGAAAATAHAPAAAVEHLQFGAGRRARGQHRRLCLAQQPARRGDARVLVAVGIADHDDLAPAAAFEVGAVEGVVQQPAQDLARRIQRIDRFEQRRDVERQAVGGGLGEACPPRQQQHREHVVDIAGHAHDVRADGRRTVAVTAVLDRLEYPKGALGARFHRLRRRLVALQGLA